MKFFNGSVPGAVEKILELPDKRIFSVFIVPIVKGDKLDGLMVIMRDFTYPEKY